MYLKNKKGIVIVTAIFMVFLISTLGIGYLFLVNNQMEIVNVNIKSAQAFYCAESGIAECVLYLKGINDWSSLSGVLISGNFEKGSYSVEVDLISHPSKDEITIKSTGKMSNFQRIIQVTLDKTGGSTIIKKDWKEI
jgi:hypothetical protein